MKYNSFFYSAVKTVATALFSVLVVVVLMADVYEIVSDAVEFLETHPVDISDKPERDSST